jgi:aspartyl protease family protein
MGDGDAPRLIWAVTLLVLSASAIFSYQLPVSRLIKMVFAWAGIFALAFLTLSFRPEMKLVWDRLTGELTSAPRQVTMGNSIRLTRLDDGHFWLRAMVNDHAVNFLVDSGASFTAINANTAARVGADWIKSDQFVDLATANGKVRAKRVRLLNIAVGDFQIKEHSVVVAHEFGDTNVVGMNFLDEFKSWNVSGDVMVLTY